MIKTIFHFFKIHRKMVLGNTAVIVQNMLRKTPKSFNAVNVVFSLLVHHMFRMIHFVMFAEAFQGIVAPKGVRIVYRPFAGFLSDDSHKVISRYTLHHTRIDPSVALQKAKYNAFALCTSSALTFASAAEIALIHFNLTRQFLALQFCHMIDYFTQLLVDSCDCLVVHPQIMGKFVGRLQLIKTGNDTNFLSYTFERLLFSTTLLKTPYIPASCFTYLERTTENALSTPQEVGRTGENVLLPCNHKGILTSLGYETH